MYTSKHDDLASEEPLAEYIFEWLEHGNAVVESGGDFGTYMQGVIYIIAKWLEDPSILDYEGSVGEESQARRAPSLVGDLQTFERTYAFDRDWFNAVIFRRLLKEDSV